MAVRTRLVATDVRVLEDTGCRLMEGHVKVCRDHLQADIYNIISLTCLIDNRVSL